MAEEAKILKPSKVIEGFRELIGREPIEYKLGDPVADQHIRIRMGQLNIILGHPSVGKTTWIVWYLYQIAKRHGIKVMLYSGENDVQEIYSQLVQIHTGKKYWQVTQEESEEAADFLMEHFFFIDDTEIYTAEELFERFESMDVNVCVIDPHNSVKVPDRKNWYEYSVELGMQIRAFCKRTRKTVFICAHPRSEAQRRVHKDGDFEGMPMPPIGPDIEGGGTWKNKCDNFWIVHRYVQHGSKWMQTHLIVEKVRYQDTGVTPTNIDHPVIFRRQSNGQFLIGSELTYQEKASLPPSKEPWEY